jgi:DNA repair photolyase
MKVKSVSKRQGTFRVFNIATEKNHDYFAEGVLVHNCFSQYQRGLGKCREKYLAKDVKAVSITGVQRAFTSPGSQFFPWTSKKRIIQWGGLSDPFCNYEKKYSVGLGLLRWFRSVDYPISFSTKGTWWTKDPRYTEFFQGNKKWNVKVTIITHDEAKARMIERRVDSPKERLKAIERIAAFNGGGATLRLRPFVVGVSNPSFVRLIEDAKNAGATAVSTEFFCYETRSDLLRENLGIFKKASGIDFEDFYKKNSAGAGYLRLNRDIKRPFMDKIQETCDRVGMRLYISDAHFKERSHNGSCCGLPESFDYSRGQFCEALCIARKTGRVEWKDISWDMEHLKAVPYCRAEGFNQGNDEHRVQFWNHTLYDFMRWLWNNPSSGKGPYIMFGGIIKPTGKDAEGNLIYEFDPKVA